MPPVGYTKKNKQPPRAKPASLSTDAPLGIKLNDGSKGTDGILLRRAPMSNCSDCGRPIRFIRVGARCTTCAVGALTPVTELSV